jgi:hypothetical protein
MWSAFESRVWPNGIGILFVLCTGLEPAWAQTGGKNPAAAQALYDDARRLVDAGRFAEACPKFKASYELDPGGGTLLNLADCYEREGKVALAWSTFKEALVIAQRDGRNDRIEFANQHLVALEGRLARLTVTLSNEARVPGISVSVDGTPLGEAAWGVAMPIDPGKHVVRVEAPGKQPFEATFEVAANVSAQKTIVVPALTDAAARVDSNPAEFELSDAPGAVPGARHSSSQRTIGWIVGGAGVASLAVGSYFGLRAFSRWEDRKDACAGGCTQAAKTAGDEANDAATISTIGFGVGFVAAAVGTFLIVSGAKERPSTSAVAHRIRVLPTAGRREAGLLLRSTW